MNHPIDTLVQRDSVAAVEGNFSASRTCDAMGIPVGESTVEPHGRLQCANNMKLIPASLATSATTPLPTHYHVIPDDLCRFLQEALHGRRMAKDLQQDEQKLLDEAQSKFPGLRLKRWYRNVFKDEQEEERRQRFKYLFGTHTR